MKQTSIPSDFRHYLLQELSARKFKNRSYSIRAFSRDLGMNPSRLICVLNGRYGISPEAARDLAMKLKLSESDAEIFHQLVSAKHARTEALRQSARERLIAMGVGTSNVENETLRSLIALFLKKMPNDVLSEVLATEGVKSALEKLKLWNDRITH